MSDILENLKKAVLEYDNDGAQSLAKKAIDEEIDPIKVADVLTDAIREVGEGFGRGELWLPDLIGAAATMQAAMPVIEAAIKKSGKVRESLGRVVIGTVLGDIHSIGKDMVATLLVAVGFEVINLGIDIKANQFISAVKEHNPSLLAMSALMTMTAPEQGKVITALKEEGLRDKVKIMIGGGAITQEFADKIGADGYAVAATGAVDLAKKLLGKGE
ncbi:B12-binding domain-containing protein [Chloroflexota bacterium]